MSSQACYVLSCDSWNDHAAMFCISAATLRREHPHVDVVLVSDAVTLAHLAGYRGAIERYATRIVQVDKVLGTARERSRVLKTTIRRQLEGPLVFIDLDTLIVGPLDRLFETRHALAIALDYERGLVDERDRAVYEYLDPAHYPARAFNSGVMVIGDSGEVHSFFDEWHRRWLRTKAFGRVDDQPALNSTLAAHPYDLEVLDPDYNAMILYFPQRFKTCRVAHFLASTEMFHTLMVDMLATFNRSGTIDWEVLDRCIEARHPWGREPEAWQLVRSGNYLRAAAAKIRRLINV